VGCAEVYGRAGNSPAFAGRDTRTPVHHVYSDPVRDLAAHDGHPGFLRILWGTPIFERIAGEILHHLDHRMPNRPGIFEKAPSARSS